jgi:hypothetical protein
MEHSHAVYALLRLHAELAGEIVKHKNRQRRLRRDLEKVRAVIRMLEPNINIQTEAILRRKPNPWFKHGTLYPAAVAIIKAAERPLCAPEIASALLKQRGITPPDWDSVYALRRSIERSLTYNRGRSIVAVGSHPVHWKLAD